MADGLTVVALAEDLAVDPADVRATIVDYLGLDLHDDVVPAAVCAEVRFILDPHGERKVPEYYGFTGQDV